MIRARMVVLLCLFMLLGCAAPAFATVPPVMPPAPKPIDPATVTVYAHYEWFPSSPSGQQGVQIFAYVVAPGGKSVDNAPVQLQISEDGTTWANIYNVHYTQPDEGTHFVVEGIQPGTYFRAQFLGLDAYAPATSKVMHVGFDNPLIFAAGFAGPVAYELKSLQSTRFGFSASEPDVNATLVVHGARSDGGDLALFTDSSVKLWPDPSQVAWTGRNEKGQRLRSGVYSWTLTATRPGRTPQTVKGSVLVCRIVFDKEGVSIGGSAQALRGYMIRGDARVYLTAFSPIPGGDTVSIRLTGPAAFSTASRSFHAESTTDFTSRYTGPSAPPYRGIYTLTITARRNLGYRVTVIQ